MKFKIDENLCICCGACQAICDKVFKISDEGFAVAKDEEIKDEEIKDEAISAMESCPTDAITNEEA